MIWFLEIDPSVASCTISSANGAGGRALRSKKFTKICGAATTDIIDSIREGLAFLESNASETGSSIHHVFITEDTSVKDLDVLPFEPA
jgi:hypothetical protein